MARLAESTNQHIIPRIQVDDTTPEADGLGCAPRRVDSRARIAIAAKSVSENPKIPGTIFTAAAEIEAAGGKALALACDIRFDDQVEAAMQKTVETFGGVDILINNASAIDLRGIDKLDMKRFDLMHQVNARGSFMVSKLAVPYLKAAENPHILMLSPPLDLKEKWFAAYTAYSIAKYGMSLAVLGLAGELRRAGIAVNALWPRTTIDTEAIRLIAGQQARRHARHPAIMADAASGRISLGTLPSF